MKKLVMPVFLHINAKNKKEADIIGKNALRTMHLMGRISIWCGDAKTIASFNKNGEGNVGYLRGEGD